MKKNKIKILLFGICCIAWLSNANAQATATPNNYAPLRYLGYFNNGTQPLYFNSNGIDRMMMNGRVFPSISGGAPWIREGFLGLGNRVGFFPTTGGLGPFSLLHLNGDNALAGPQQSGYRDWMRFGIVSTHNRDLMFIGQRATAGTDITDAVIGWSDNSSNNAPGPDNMVFNFLAGPHGGNDDLSGTASFGREVMRLTATGNVGIGPRFTNAAQPQSQLHINGEDYAPTYLMITSQLTTGQTVGDGFHLGIAHTGIAEIRQRENLDMHFFTANTQRAVIKSTGSIGFGTNTPGNELEITSQPGNFNYATASGSSGLRFTNMTSSSTPMPNPGGVLSLNSTGDVIYVSNSGSANANNGVSLNGGILQLGVPCTLPGGFPNLAAIFANELQEDRVIANRNKNFWIGSFNFETGGVGIGGQPIFPFCTVGNTFEVSANSKNQKYGSTNASGVRFTKLRSTSPTVAHGTHGVNNRKVLTVDKDGDVVLTDACGCGGGNFGDTCGASVGLSNLPNNWRVGMNNHSINFEGTGNINIGDVPACSPGSSSFARVWIRNTFGSPNPTTGLRVDNISGPFLYAAEFHNSVYINGPAVGPVPGLTFSDKNLKENIMPINNSLAILLKLKPVSYNLKKSALPQSDVDVTKAYGLIAQDVETIIPELVKDIVVPAGYNSSGTATIPAFKVKSLNYTGFIPFIINGVQELNAKQIAMQASVDKISLLERLVKEQQSTIDDLKASLARQSNINNDVQKQLAALLTKLK